MSRLVDSEDVKEVLRELDEIPFEEEIDYVVNSIFTAYDVEKVVENLKQLSFSLPNGDNRVIMLDEAIEIVKGGK